MFRFTIAFVPHFRLGKTLRWGTFLKCGARFHYLNLSPLFWECAHHACPYHQQNYFSVFGGHFTSQNLSSMKGEEAFQKPKHLLEWARMPSVFFLPPFSSNDTWRIPTTYHDKNMEVKHSVWFVTQRNVLRARHSLKKKGGWQNWLHSQSASSPPQSTW